MGDEETVRWHVTTTKLSKQRVEELMRQWFPGRERMQGPVLDRIIREAYTREIEQQGEAVKR